MNLILYVLAGMGVAALIGYFMNRKQAAARSKERAREATLGAANVTNDITRVGPGGVLKLPPFGSTRFPIETHVVKRHRYEEDGERWYELVCQHGRRELLVEWSREGRTVYVTAGFEDENPSLDELGLTEDDLIRFDDDERGSFEWQGTRWNYVESGERRYFEEDSGRGEGFYAWEFCDAAETRYVTVEKWEGDARFYVYHLWLLDTEAIEIYDGGKA